MRIAVVGTGYVGLVSGVVFAEAGHDVTCVDHRADVVERLERGEATIHERDLPEALAQVRRAGCFRATTDLDAAMADATIVLVAVGTPTVNGVIDLSQVEAAVRAIGTRLRDRIDPVAVIIKSTVVPGTTDTHVRRWLRESTGRSDDAYGLGMAPEFLREGEAMADCRYPDRVVLGHEDPVALAALRALFAPWQCPKLEVNTRTAELVKYANNCLLATQISAVNEIANVAAALGGVDIHDVMRGVHLDRRWSPVLADGTRVEPGILRFLEPGCGFGGSCFPKDVQALYAKGTALNLPMAVLRAVLDVNAAQPARVAALLQDALGSLVGKRVLLLGLAFKPGTDDVRESASLRIAESLRDAGATLLSHDPIAMSHAVSATPSLALGCVDNWRDALSRVDAIVVATAWDEYRALSSPALRHRVAGRVIVDARRMFNPTDFADAEYRAIGFTPPPAARRAS